ncbi:MAG: bacteriorhodopsin [Haloferacaceae archaeon]|jgi:bacteriorhodopsin
MVELSIWYGLGAGLLLVGTVTFVAFAALRNDLGSSYYSLPPLQSVFGAVSYAVLALAALGEVTWVPPAVLRYLAVFLTLPVAIYYLGLLGGVSAERSVTAVSLAMVVVVAAYLTTVTAGRLRLGLAVLSGVMLLALLRTIVRSFAPPDTESSLFLSLRDLTVAALLVYPAAYLLGPAGAGYLVAADLGFVQLVVHVAFSLGFLVLVVARTYELEAATGGAATPG